MINYIVRRLLWGLVLLIAVTALIFILFRVLPTADPATLRAGRLQSPKIIAEIRADLGLDKSLPAQFWIYLKGILLHFNLGYSYYSGASVKSLLFDRLPATVSLVLGGAVVWVTAGLTVGILSALRPRSRRDRASMGGALLLVSAPEYWLGLIVLYLFAADIGQLRIFPGSGSHHEPRQQQRGEPFHRIGGQRHVAAGAGADPQLPDVGREQVQHDQPQPVFGSGDQE